MHNDGVRKLADGVYSELLSKIIALLNTLSIEYDLLNIDLEAKDKLSFLVRAALLKDEFGYILALYPAQRILDFPSLCRAVSRDLECVNAATDDNNFEQIFDSALNSYTAFPVAWQHSNINIKALLDLSLTTADELYLCTGTDAKVIKIEHKDFNKLYLNSWCANFTLERNNVVLDSAEITKELMITKIKNSFTARRMQSRIKETFELPIMTPIVDKLLRIRLDPTAGASELAKIISLDPSLAAQLISWACSPYYGYPGKVSSIEDAIIKVLGYDLVINMALGIAIGQMMRIQHDGPLGLKKYWQQSIYVATLVEHIVKIIPTQHIAVYRGLVYLAGLLHNLGYLLLGHLFPPQFYLLNQSIELNPGVVPVELEHSLFQLNNIQLGVWLMQEWHMPEEVIFAVKYQQDENYHGKYNIYANILCIAIRFLNKSDLTLDKEKIMIPQNLIDSLGINNNKLENIFKKFMEDRYELDSVIKLLV